MFDENLNFIHPTAYIADNVKIGHNNYIGPFCMIYADVVIGNNNRFEGHCSIGSPAEKVGYFKSETPDCGNLIIGNNNIIREFTTLNTGTRRSTVMGNNCIMLRGSHLSHDSILENDINVSCNVLIGGESHIMIGANLGLGAILHQFSVVGSYAMIGMGTVCTKRTSLFPGNIYVGNPAKVLKRNNIGLSRKSISGQKLKQETDRWYELKKTNI